MEIFFSADMREYHKRVLYFFIAAVVKKIDLNSTLDSVNNLNERSKVIGITLKNNFCCYFCGKFSLSLVPNLHAAQKNVVEIVLRCGKNRQIGWRAYFRLSLLGYSSNNNKELLVTKNFSQNHAAPNNNSEAPPR
jgi:hypothetical protein